MEKGSIYNKYKPPEGGYKVDKTGWNVQENNKPISESNKDKNNEEWGMMVSGGTYREESDVWLSHKDGEWFVDGKKTPFQEVLSDYRNLLRQRAEGDGKLRELLKQSR